MDQGLDQVERRHRIALIAVPGIGPRHFLRLLERFGSAQAALGASEAALRGAGVPAAMAVAMRTPDWRLVERACVFVKQPDCALLLHDESDYPPLLREMADPPPVLYVRGSIAALHRAQIAIVGSRQASSSGRRHARELASEFSSLGLVVTSGLAQGIDAAAHRGALEHGPTIAVLGSGIDRVYPEMHRDLADEIVAGGGTLVSELALMSAPLAANFPRRNRIISGLSVGVVVVEARARSGSLITARHALEQGRDVFALPGSIDNPLALGCNELIQQGAKLVCRVEDVIDELMPYPGAGKSARSQARAAASATHAGLSEPMRKLLEITDTQGVTLDELVDRSGLTVSEVSSMLSHLELAGLIETRPGGLYISGPG